MSGSETDGLRADLAAALAVIKGLHDELDVTRERLEFVTAQWRKRERKAGGAGGASCGELTPRPNPVP